MRFANVNIYVNNRGGSTHLSGLATCPHWCKYHLARTSLPPAFPSLSIVRITYHPHASRIMGWRTSQCKNNFFSWVIFVSLYATLTGYVTLGCFGGFPIYILINTIDLPLTFDLWPFPTQLSVVLTKLCSLYYSLSHPVPRRAWVAVSGCSRMEVGERSWT